MAKSQHMYDQVANDLAQWIDETAGHLANAMMPGGVAPFGANVSKQKQIEYYDAQFFNSDGTPNVQGRQAELGRLGVAGYTQAMQQVMEHRKGLMGQLQE